eukprot:11396277-Karenia_brevis.AAC.1
MISRGQTLTRTVAKWLGTLGAFLLSKGSPGVQPVPATGPIVLGGNRKACNQNLNLVEVPHPEDPGVQAWQPRVLDCEHKNVLPRHSARLVHEG